MASILLVDDDRDLLDMISTLLTTYGHHVVALHIGSELIPTISLVAPEVIILDIYLGDCDGRALCHQIKTASTFSHIPVLLYSAGVIPFGSIQDCLADAFLPKPFDIHELLNKVALLTHNV